MSVEFRYLCQNSCFGKCSMSQHIYSYSTCLANRFGKAASSRFSLSSIYHIKYLEKQKKLTKNHEQHF